MRGIAAWEGEMDMNGQIARDWVPTAPAAPRLLQPGTVVGTADLDLPKAHTRKAPVEEIVIRSHGHHPDAFICILELALFILIVLPIFCIWGVGGIFEAIGDRKHL